MQRPSGKGKYSWDFSRNRNAVELEHRVSCRGGGHRERWFREVSTVRSFGLYSEEGWGGH